MGVGSTFLPAKLKSCPPSAGVIFGHSGIIADVTILVAAVWGGRVSVVVDRQVSQRTSAGLQVVDAEASKLLVVMCGNALFSISYTGVAVTSEMWMDEAIASCLAFRQIKPAMVQPGGGFFLARPVHELLKNLAFNLPIRLRANPSVSTLGLTFAIAGWHLGPKSQPFIWEMTWQPEAANVGGSMSITRHQVAKHFRQFRTGIWMETWGDTDRAFVEKMNSIARTTVRLTHDDVEQRIVDAIAERSGKTLSVGGQCLALQLDLRYALQAPIQFTYYPTPSAHDPHQLLSGWLLTPTMIHSPTRESTGGSDYSTCGRYLLGGFSDQTAPLHVRTRIPIASVRHGGPTVMSYAVQVREPPSRG
jgi:hypothetical protein